jgi:hypothetical protein
MKKAAVENQEAKLAQQSNNPECLSLMMTKPIIDNLMENVKDKIIFNQIES